MLGCCSPLSSGRSIECTINRVNYDSEATAAGVGASLSFGLIKNHAFLDGNKRIGLAALLHFLALNELRLAASKPEVLATVLRVAASGMSEGEWTAWVERSVQPDISFRK